MQKNKRGGDDLTRSSHKSRRCCSGGVEIIHSLTSGDDLPGASDLDVWTELGDEVKTKLSKSVVSLALCNAIECKGHVTKFVTSARLVRAISDPKLTKKKGDHNYRIQVRHEGNEVYQGFLAEYNLDQNFAIVNVMAVLNVHIVLLEYEEEILPLSKVVTVKRDICGKLTARSVILTQDLSESEHNEGCMLSACKISEAWEGGPLFSFDGKFVGMNLFLDMKKAFFLPWGTILERVEKFWTSLLEERDIPQLKSLKGVRVGETSTGELSKCYPEVHRGVLNKEPSGDLDSMLQNCTMFLKPDDMVLANTFEETFGDVCGQGIWSELSKTATSNLNRSVVALASFKGETMFFACTGIFIEWNNRAVILTSASLVRNSGGKSKIEKELRIEVLLPGKHGRKEGKLEHYSLHYNVALVSVEDFRVVRPANVQLQWSKCSNVAAVGRCFNSGKLMAVGGQLVPWSGTLDCKYLVHSSCKISKAGIGGPLVDLDGQVIGMNFYDKRVGTPFLLWNVIRKILACFKRESDRGKVGHGSTWRMPGDRQSVRLKRWPVRHLDNTNETQDDLDFEQLYGCNQSYGYINGLKVAYC
ncbi:unnamed protein product [Urochloa decumbens]|uniref:Uncharacterized protein n=1 Tax=Urochloa decumbens TaxID=240449 RepID=A0ABC9GYU7_9POAL